jgi:molybdate transport system ATP-binding protein
MSVETNLLFGSRRAPPGAQPRQSEIISLLDLERLLNRSPRNLSGGEKQRVAIGRALLAAPDILLLDEPMAGLDAARRAEVLPYLERLRDEAQLPMLYVSHTLDEVARLANDIVVLRDGRVVAQGSVFDVLPEIDSTTGAIIPTVVAKHRDDGLSELSFAGGNLIVGRVSAAIGSHLRVRVAAQDVMLAREEPRLISANNVLPAHISEIRDASDRLADIHLTVGKTKLHARITKASATRLALEPGTLVYAIIKAVTVAPQGLPSFD